MANSPLNIVHVTSAGRLIYGAVHSMLTLANAQRKAADNISFVTFRGRPFTQELRNLGWNVQDVPVKIKLDLRAVFEMRRAYRAVNADIIHTHLSTSSLNGGLAARFAKIPCVSTVHGMSGKLSYLFSDHLIGVSQGVRNHLIGQGVLESKVTAIYNGVHIPSTTDTKVEIRSKLGIPSEAIVVGTVSRLNSLKGIEFALQAFESISQRIENAHYLLVGDGDQRSEYQAWVNNRGMMNRVHFLGYREDVFEPLRAMDLFLFPSLKEAMGIAVVEAMGVGLPVVSTNVGGLPEVVDANSGILVPPSQAVALASAAIQIIESHQGSAMGAHAANRVNHLFSIDSMRDQTRQVYQQLIIRS